MRRRREHMQITHSKKIGHALSALAKRKQLKVAKDMGIWWTCLTRINQINDLIETLGFRYGNLPDMVYGTAHSSQTTIFFDEPEEVILQKLEAIKPTPKGKTAPKVFVRMIYDRIVKLQKTIDEVDEMAQQMLQVMRQNPQAYGGQSWANTWVKPVITERWFDDPTLIPNHYGIKQAGDDLYAVASRPDATEEIRQQAWNLWKTHVIMDS